MHKCIKKYLLRLLVSFPTGPTNISWAASKAHKQLTQTRRQQWRMYCSDTHVYQLLQKVFLSLIYLVSCE